MSDMLTCNYCTMQNIKERAKKDNSKIITRDNAGFALGGVNVYIVPKGKRFDKDKHLVAWFMELPERCAC